MKRPSTGRRDVAEVMLGRFRDVGLGKTIEAGLVVQEMLLRHREISSIVRTSERGSVPDRVAGASGVVQFASSSFFARLSLAE